MAFRKRKADELNAAKTSRMKGTTIERTIVFGNVSWWLGKDADEAHTHRWVTFVRGPNNEDISYFIKKVVFTLHPSFQNPVRGVFWLSDRCPILTLLLFSYWKAALRSRRNWMGRIRNRNQNSFRRSFRTDCGSLSWLSTVSFRRSKCSYHQKTCGARGSGAACVHRPYGIFLQPA